MIVLAWASDELKAGGNCMLDTICDLLLFIASGKRVRLDESQFRHHNFNII
jgi:hypothetical protein